MRRPRSELPIAQETYTRPKCALRGLVSTAIHCLSKTEVPLNGVVAIRSTRPPCTTFQALAVEEPLGRTATPIPDRGNVGLGLLARKPCSPSGAYENMYGSTTT